MASITRVSNVGLFLLLLLQSPLTYLIRITVEVITVIIAVITVRNRVYAGRLSRR